MDEELWQSRLGCGVLVGLALVVMAVAAVAGIVRDALCCDDDDGLVDVIFSGSPYDAFAVFDEHRAGALLEVLEPSEDDEFWPWPSYPWYFYVNPDAAFLGVANIESMATGVVVVGSSGRARMELPAGEYAICAIADDRAIDSYLDSCVLREIREEVPVFHFRSKLKQ